MDDKLPPPKSASENVEEQSNPVEDTGRQREQQESDSQLVPGDKLIQEEVSVDAKRNIEELPQDSYSKDHTKILLEESKIESKPALGKLYSKSNVPEDLRALQEAEGKPIR